MASVVGEHGGQGAPPHEKGGPPYEVASWIALAGLLGLGFAQACTTPELVEDDLTVQALLRDVGTLVVLPTLRAFQQEVLDLQVALASDTTEAQQAAWVDTMTQWQQAEVMQLGPAGSSLTAAGGLDLREEIYSWPTVNPCRVDQITVDGSWVDADFFQSNLVNAYGLDALEYTLWAGPDNACPPQLDINAEGLWDDLGPQGVVTNRAALSVVLAEGVLTQSEALITAWDADGFTLALENATDPYQDQAEALDAVFQGIFYLETVTKERKLAEPLATGSDFETPYAGISGTSVSANLKGTLAIFQGGSEGTGFDDLLVERGFSDLASQIITDLETAITLSETMLDLSTEDTDQVQALHDAVKKVGDALKGDLATVLSLTIPDEAAGDLD